MMRLKKVRVAGECARVKCHTPSSVIVDTPTSGGRLELCDRDWHERCAEEDRAQATQ